MYLYNKYVLKTNEPVDDMINKLNNILEPHKLFQSSITTDKKYAGIITNDKFRIYRIIGYWNPFRPIIDGLFIKSNNYNKVIITMKFNSNAIINLIFITLLTLLLSSVAIIFIMENSTTRLYSIIWLLIIIIFDLFQYMIYRYECKKAIKDLSILFNSKDICIDK
jgi:hypothetical protein